MTPEYSISGLVTINEDASVHMRSQTTGASVKVDRGDDGGTTYDLVFPAFEGHEELRESFDDILDLEDAYVKQWIRWTAVTVGLGFHPDTPAEDYEPPLSAPLAAEYDRLIEISHGYTDPYEVSIEAWNAAGLVEGSDTKPNA
ncbi:hypothetical protein G6L37_34795 [Agrobacterium rubi]|nr:hypothetical protein [Agrobacterium rubi]NTF23737.1 hypothetical protein [Agrobacterium rubi]